MSLQKVPLVTTLLRASRDADEELLRTVLRDILLNGIPSKDLNSDDNSGRVSSTNFILNFGTIQIEELFF